VVLGTLLGATALSVLIPTRNARKAVSL